MKTRTWLTLAWTMVLLAVLEQPAAAFYDPQACRWFNRDPIGERGGLNLHAFVVNAPIWRRFDAGL